MATFGNAFLVENWDRWKDMKKKRRNLLCYELTELNIDIWNRHLGQGFIRRGDLTERGEKGVDIRRYGRNPALVMLEEEVDIRVYGQPPTFVTLGENETAIREITRLPRTWHNITLAMAWKCYSTSWIGYGIVDN